MRQKYKLEVDQGASLIVDFKFGTKSDGTKTYAVVDPAVTYHIRFRNQDYAYHVEYPLTSTPEDIWTLELTPEQTALFDCHRAMYFAIDRRTVVDDKTRVKRMLTGPVNVTPLGVTHYA